MHINITVKRSYLAIKLIFFCYFLVLFSLYITNLTWLYKTAILGCAIICIHSLLTIYLLGDNKQIDRIHYHNSVWQIRINNTWFIAKLTSHFNSNYFICLEYLVDNKKHWLVLFNDATTKKEYHHLTLSLKLLTF